VPSDPVSPIIVKVVEEPAPTVGLADVIIQAIGLTGALFLGAVLLGLLLGGAFIALRRLRPDNAFNGAKSEHQRLGLGSLGR